MYRYIDIVRTDIRCCCSEYINNYIHTNTQCVLVSMNQYDVFSIWCCMIKILTSYSTVNLWGFEFNTLRCLDVVRNVSIHHDYRSSHPTSRKKAISSGSNHGTPHPVNSMTSGNQNGWVDCIKNYDILFINSQQKISYSEN